MTPQEAKEIQEVFGALSPMLIQAIEMAMLNALRRHAKETNIVECIPGQVNVGALYKDIAKTVEHLQPKSKSTDSAPVAKMREMLAIQGSSGTWNCDPYMHGMYNGMEYMLAMAENRDPIFRDAPAKWLNHSENRPKTDEINGERAVWAQAYAACYMHSYITGEGFDNSMEARAGTTAQMADLAVEAFRARYK
jgi:hypothetical protein